MRLLLLLSAILACCVLGETAWSAPPPGAAKETKRVLVLFSEDEAHPAHALTQRGIRAVFESNGRFEVQLYIEYLDEARFGARAMADYLRRKYSGVEVDAIIAVYPYALDFLLNNRRTLFPRAPIVAAELLTVSAAKLERSPARRFATATVLGDNIASVIDSALHLRPKTKRLALVAGTADTDFVVERIVRAGFRSRAAKLELIDLTKLPMAETLARAGSLPPDTLLFYSTLFNPQWVTSRYAVPLDSRSTGTRPGVHSDPRRRVPTSVRLRA